MTLKKVYNEIMDKIELSDEMRKRILNNISNISPENTSKIVNLHSYKKYISIAACFILLLVGVITIPSVLQRDKITQPPDVTIISPDLEEATSIEELSKMVGFEVNDLSVLPFAVTQTTYMSYWGELAEITYLGDGQTATYRISLGDEDISGDYNNYQSVIEVKINENLVTLKGNDEKYTLAIWNDKKYSYSIQISEGISKDDWSPILKQLD